MVHYLESFCRITTFFQVCSGTWLAVTFRVSDCIRNALQQKMPLLMQDLLEDMIPVAFLLHLRIKLGVQKDAC